MNIEQSQIKKLLITDVKGLDPITVFLEDLEPRKGKITIECFGASWSSYWGGMGSDTVAAFVSSCGDSYLANCLWDHAQEQTELDYDGVQAKVRKAIVELRRESLVDAYFAREIYDIENWEQYAPQHTYDVWSCPDWLDEDDFERLNLDDESISERNTSKFDYLNKIVTAVQEALQSLNQVKAA